MNKIIFFFIFIFSIENFSYSQIAVGASLEPGNFLDKHKNISAKNPAYFEQNFVIYFGTASLMEVLSSTSPVEEILRYSINGFSRSEIIFLTLLSMDKKIKLKELTDKILKGRKLSEISKEYSYDFMTNFSKAVDIKNKIEDKSRDIKYLNEILVNSQNSFSTDE